MRGARERAEVRRRVLRGAVVSALRHPDFGSARTGNTAARALESSLWIRKRLDAHVRKRDARPQSFAERRYSATKRICHR
jgi:hypothetical protein